VILLGDEHERFLFFFLMVSPITLSTWKRGQRHLVQQAVHRISKLTHYDVFLLF
jgi:hypothetical protein